MSIIDRLTTTDPATRPLRRRTKAPAIGLAVAMLLAACSSDSSDTEPSTMAGEPQAETDVDIDSGDEHEADDAVETDDDSGADAADITRLLEPIGFSAEGTDPVTVTIPTRRHDSATEIDVNIYDLEIAHSTEGDRGVVILVVPAATGERLVGALMASGYRPSIRAIEQ